METLIQITTGGQGSPVVSARELYTFMGVRTKFSTWITQRIKDFDFIEGRDYTTFTENLENGGRTIEYALTLNMAKELSMVERNQKGKQARQYFIKCEETLLSVATAPAQPPPALNTEQLLIQLMAGQQEILTRLQADIEQIKATGHRPPKALPGRQLSLPGTQARQRPGHAAVPLRQHVHQKVVDYCTYHDATTQETYNYLYKRMMDVYGVNVYRLLRNNGESLLDALEHYGHLDRLYSLIMAELNYSED